jgi:hypothetical protein
MRRTVDAHLDRFRTSLPTSPTVCRVLFESGMYTGTVPIQTDATICVAGPANLNPSSFNGSAGAALTFVARPRRR